jgi:H-type small acid-soluble spore protein
MSERSGVMNISRVEQILNSPQKIDVFYNNKPVWIQNFYEENKTADVSIIDSKQVVNVAITDLTEAKST